MIETSELIYKIKNSVHDDTLYLLEKNSDSSGFFAYNGNILFVVKNEGKCDNVSVKTEYLHFESNIHISSFENSSQSFENGFYNYIELYVLDIDEQIENVKAFLNVCRAFTSQDGDVDFITFFDSLVKIFQLPQEQEFKNLIGLYGELSIIKYFFDNFKVDLSTYWHTDGINSKIDITIPNVNIEVKTSITDQLIFKLKHAQLFDNTVETYLAAVSITRNNSGASLNELIEEMLNNHFYCNSLSFALNIEAEKRKISPKEAENKRFVFKNIKLYNTKEICQFPVVPEIISDLSYKINLIGLGIEDILTVVDKIK